MLKSRDTNAFYFNGYIAAIGLVLYLVVVYFAGLEVGRAIGSNVEIVKSGPHLLILGVTTLTLLGGAAVLATGFFVVRAFETVELSYFGRNLGTISKVGFYYTFPLAKKTKSNVRETEHN